MTAVFDFWHLWYLLGNAHWTRILHSSHPMRKLSGSLVSSTLLHILFFSDSFSSLIKKIVVISTNQEPKKTNQGT